MADKEELVVSLRADAAGLEKELSSSKKSIANWLKDVAKAGIKIGIDIGALKESAKEANDKLNNYPLFKTTKRISVAINQKNLETSVNEAQRKISKLKDTNLKINLDIKHATSGIMALYKMINEITNKKIVIDTDARRITTKIQNIQGRLDTLSNKDVNLNTGNLELKLMRLATYINQLNSKDIKPKVDKGIEDIVKLSTYMNNLKSKDTKLSIDVDLNKAKTGILAIYKMITELVGKKYKLELDTSTITGKNSQLATTANTLKNIGDALKTIKSKTINIKFNTGRGNSSLGNIVRTLRNFNRDLQNVKNRINVNITVNENDSITKLTTILSLLRQIKRNSRININTNSSGQVRNHNYDETSAGSFFVGALQFFGRSSKGIGSFGEAIARVIQNMISMGGTIGKVGTIFSIVAATSAALMTAFALGTKAVQEFGNILITVGNAIYKVLKPGLDLYNQRTRSELALAAGSRSMATIDGRAITDEESKSIGNQLTNRAIRDAAKSVFSPTELIDAMQGTMPMLYARGMTAEQAYQTTKGVASVAKLGRLAPNQVLQETRDLAQGSITARSSQVANLLGITNADINRFKGDADALYDYLMDKFKEYSKALDEYAKTPIGAFEQLQETIGIAGDSIIEGIAQPFVEVFNGITDSLGDFVDAQGHVVDEAGYYTDEYGNKVQAVGDIHYQVAEPLQNFADALKEIIEYLLRSVDGLIEYFGATTDSASITEKFVSIMEFLIDAFVVSIKFVKNMIDMMFDLADSTSLLGNVMSLLGRIVQAISVPIFEFLIRMINLLEIAFTGWQDLITLIRGATGDLSVQEVKTALVKSEKRRQELSAQNAQEYTSTFKDFAQKYGLANNTNGGFLTDLYEKGKERAIREQKQQQNVDLNKVQGKQTEDTKANEKAMKAAIKQSQKELKARLAELRTLLEDKLDKLKDILEENELKYSQGFMTIDEYYSQKAQAELEQAKLNLDEAHKERIEIENALYQNEEDRAKDLAENDKKINKYTKETAKAEKGIRELSRVFRDTTKMLGNFVNALNSGKLVNGKVVSSKDKVVPTESLISFGDKYGISEDIVREVVKQSAQYGANSDKFAKMALAMMIQESGGNQNAISSAGAIGLMQLMPDTARGLGVDPYTVSGNIEGGLKYINELFEQFGDNIDNVIAAYNAGPQAVRDYGGVPPYTETQNHVRIVRGYYDELEQLGTQAVSIASETAGSIYDAIDIALNRDGYLGQTLKYGRKACVEAGTKLGAYYSDAFKEAVNRGIVNTDVLDEFFDEIGVPSIPWDSGNLNPGDIIFFDGEKQNQHVMLFKGNGMVAGNFTSGNNGAGAVNEQSLEDYLKYSGLIPTHIRKTGTHGLSSNFYASDSIGQAINDSAYLSKTALEEFEAVKEFESKTAEMAASIMEGTFGYPMQKIQQLQMEYENEVRNITGRWANSKIPEYREAGLKRLEVMKKKYDLEVFRLTRDSTEQLFDYQLESVRREIENSSNNIALQRTNVGKSLANLVNDIDSKYGLGKLINELEQARQTLISIGRYSEAREIGDKLSELKDLVLDAVDSWIEQGQKYWSTAEEIFNATPRFTPTQREFAEREFKAYRAQIEYEGRIAKGHELASQYQEQLKAYNDLIEKQKTLVEGSKEYEDNQREITSVLQDKTRTEALMAENDQMRKLADLTRKMPDYLDDVGKAARDALDNGLTEFLTDGILEAESLGDALKDLAYNILKEIQKVNVKWMVKGLMNAIFGQFDVPTDMTLTDVNTTLINGFSSVVEAINSSRNVFGTPEENTNIKDGFWSDYDRKQLGVFGEDTYEKSELNPNYRPWETEQGWTTEGLGLQTFEDTVSNASQTLDTSIQNSSVTIENSSQNLTTSVDGLTRSTENLSGVINSLANGSQQQNIQAQQGTDLFSGSLSNNASGITGSGISVGGVESTGYSKESGFKFSQITSSSQSWFGSLLGAGIQTFLGGGLGSSIGRLASYVKSNVIGSPWKTTTTYSASSPRSGLPSDSKLGSAATVIANLTGEDIDTSKSETELTGDLYQDLQQLAQEFVNTLQTVLQVLNQIKEKFEELSKSLDDLIVAISEQLQKLNSSSMGFGFFASGGIVHLAKGGAVYNNHGLIRGPGSETSDSIPAMLSNGEAVLNAKAVRRLGTNFVTAVNSGNFSKIRASIPHFADGGFVGDARQDTARGMLDFARDIGTNVTTNNQMNIALVRDETEAMEHFMRSPKGERILVDFSRKHGSIISSFGGRR